MYLYYLLTYLWNLIPSGPKGITLPIWYNHFISLQTSTHGLFSIKDIHSFSASKTSSETGLRNTLAVPPSTLRTFLSLLGNVFAISPMGHSFLLTWESFNRTTSPSLTLGLVSVHFAQLCRVDRYSPFHLFQKEPARCWTCLLFFQTTVLMKSPQMEQK